MPKPLYPVVGGCYHGARLTFKHDRVHQLGLKRLGLPPDVVFVPIYWPEERSPEMLAIARIYGGGERTWPEAVRLRYFGPKNAWPWPVRDDMDF